MGKPGASRKRAQPADDYEDDGFLVEDEDGPPLKKRSNAGAEPKKGKKEVQTGVRKDDDGTTYWELSAQRRVTVSEFKGKSMVSIREYYEKDGKSLPGKKGISLPLEQYSALLSVLPDIEAVLAQKGEKVPRPEYDGAGGPVQKDELGDDDDEDEENAADGARKNFEATSDEEE